ncbi:MAG: terpene cyclase/mutase family protein [Kiritimatiellae bacterium]|nr:terpene cyclase/mutase family protein [Kiritimatiellia bacterium]MDW8458783.1 terpene cyclase/mutase family protein [Verrucomicrobiota bacterium]
MDAKEREEFLRKYKIKKIMEHMTGPIGSVIFHILVILLAIKFMVFDTMDKAPDIEVTVVEPESVDLEEFEKELEKIEELTDLTDVALPTDMPVQMDSPTPTDSPRPSEDVSMDLAELNIVADQSPLVMKGLFAGRSAEGRSSGLSQYAGRWASAVDRAVIKALEWLKRNQAPDGSWGPNKPGMTGLGLLTFLAHGETTASKEYGQTVEKAIRFLLSIQRPDGAFGSTDSGPAVYAHAIATYAIAEAYGLTRIPELKPAMEKAVDIIVKGQQPGGLWDYKYDKGARWDTSVSGWQVQALKAAYIAGAEVPGLKEAMDRAVVGFVNSQNPETGRFGYSSVGNGSDGITAVGVLSLQLLGQHKSKAVQAGLNAMREFKCDYRNPPIWPMYSWYYITQAKFHHGGQLWSSWNNQFAPELTKNQNEDGSWTSAGQFLKEDAHGKETNHGLVYSTTLAALTLQVYYRFLPTYKPIAVESEEDEKKDDVTVEII